jgi:ABC-type methionine transport system ATPase subunit
MPEIEKFTELGEWFERPVRMYSSGMLAKLGFAVAMYVDAEVLLIDEVLSVGDFTFQKKCVTRMAEISSRGVTIVFVSHNPYMIERMCDKVVWVQQGRFRELGTPGDIIPKYFEMSVGKKTISPNDKGLPAHLRPGTGDLRIQKVEILDSVGNPIREIYTRDSVIFRLYYTTTEIIKEPNFGIRIFDPQNTMVLSLASTAVKKEFNLCDEGYLDCKVHKLSLMHNIYTVQVKVAGDVLLDMYENAAQFIVKSDAKVLVDSGNMGMVYADADWNCSFSLKSR